MRFIAGILNEVAVFLLRVAYWLSFPDHQWVAKSDIIVHKKGDSHTYDVDGTQIS